MKKFRRWMVMVLVQHRECASRHWPVHWKMVKMIHFMLYVVYHTFLAKTNRSTDLPVLGILYKWIICDLLWLASFIYHVFKVHSCYSMCQYTFLFYSWMLFQCMNRTHLSRGWRVEVTDRDCLWDTGLPSGVMKMFKNQIVAIVAWFYEYTKNYWILHFKRVDLKIYELYLNKGAIKKTEWHLRHINKSTEPVTNMVKKGTDLIRRPGFKLWLWHLLVWFRSSINFSEPHIYDL